MTSTVNRRTFLAATTAAPAATAADKPVPTVRFSRDIRPLLATKGFACHGPADLEGGLALHQRGQATARTDAKSTHGWVGSKISIEKEPIVGFVGECEVVQGIVRGRRSCLLADDQRVGGIIPTHDFHPDVTDVPGLVLLRLTSSLIRREGVLRSTTGP